MWATILGALMNLDIEMEEGALIGATPRGQVANNQSRMPIILSFASPVTRNRVLNAAKKKGRKGPGAFPINGQENLYFSEMPRPCTGHITKPQAAETQESKSDKEVTEMRKKLLKSYDLGKRVDRSRQSLKSEESQDDGPQLINPLTNLTNLVTEIIPQSRLNRPEIVANDTNPPTESSGEDLRGFLNDKRGIQEIELTRDNIETVRREIREEGQDEVPRTEDDLAITHNTQKKYKYSSGNNKTNKRCPAKQTAI